MRRTAERGEGKLGGLIAPGRWCWPLGLAAWNVAPAYFDHYDFVDKVNEICRAPRHVTRRGGDEVIMKMLMDEVRKRRLDQWIGPESFTVIDRASTGRQIQLYYEREVEILPGWKKTLKFEISLIGRTSRPGHRRPSDPSRAPVGWLHLAEDLLGDDQQLHVGGALVDLARPSGRGSTSRPGTRG